MKNTTTANTVVCALYKFVTLPDFADLKPLFQQQLLQHEIRGTLLLAEEGINGTIAGSKSAIEAFLAWLKSDQRFSDIDYKLSLHEKAPFHRTKVKLKKEIVTMGVENIDPNDIVGTYVEPDQWNELINDPETLLIDTRNEYELSLIHI